MAPQMHEVLKAARIELPPDNKKDGTQGKKNRVRFKCAVCGELFQMKTGKSSNVAVDHISPVVPLWKIEAEMTYDEIVRGVFCKSDNLQVLCSVPLNRNNGKSSCHREKTNYENWMRRELSKMGPIDRQSPVVFRDLTALYYNTLEEKIQKKSKKK
jgi:hypothetical protein